MWYRWLAHLTLTQETGVRVPAWELFVFETPLGKGRIGSSRRSSSHRCRYEHSVRGGALHVTVLTDPSYKACIAHCLTSWHIRCAESMFLLSAMLLVGDHGIPMCA